MKIRKQLFFGHRKLAIVWSGLIVELALKRTSVADDLTDQKHRRSLRG